MLKLCFVFFFACTCICIPRGSRLEGVQWQEKQAGDTWAFCPGTLHLNDITQTHGQNNTSTVEYKRDRLSDTANRRPDRYAGTQPAMTDSVKADRQTGARSGSDWQTYRHAVSLPRTDRVLHYVFDLKHECVETFQVCIMNSMYAGFLCTLFVHLCFIFYLNTFCKKYRT